jgi:hypothetical protein
MSQEKNKGIGFFEKSNRVGAAVHGGWNPCQKIPARHSRCLGRISIRRAEPPDCRTHLDYDFERFNLGSAPAEFITDQTINALISIGFFV